MDDTAFHYSRTLRIIMVLAIVLPIIGIGAILWYFSTGDSDPTSDGTEVSADKEPEEEADPEAGGDNTVGSSVTEADVNPLQPIGPKASDRVTPGSTVCSSGSRGICPYCD